MNIAFRTFSSVVRAKSESLRNALLLLRSGLHEKSVEFADIRNADLVVIYNIHHPVLDDIQEAKKYNKPIISLQEGLYGIGWKGTLDGMRKECQRANEIGIKQLVWSRFERSNYIATGRNPDLVKAVGNPYYDYLFKANDIRKEYNIPEDAFLVCELSQYAHPRGGMNEEQMKQSHKDIQSLAKDDVWTITCLHPKQSKNREIKHNGQNIIVPFRFPEHTLDIINSSDLVVSLSSTEMIASAILDKNMIEYDLSNSPHRFPFVEHGVAVRAINYQDLFDQAMEFKEGDFVKPIVDYSKEYFVTGERSIRVAKLICDEPIRNIPK